MTGVLLFVLLILLVSGTKPAKQSNGGVSELWLKQNRRNPGKNSYHAVVSQRKINGR